MAELPTVQLLETMTRAQLVATYDALRPTHPQLPERPTHGRGNFTVNIKGALLALVLAPGIPIDIPPPGNLPGIPIPPLAIPAPGNLWIPPAIAIIPQNALPPILPMDQLPPQFMGHHFGREQIPQYHLPPQHHGRFQPPIHDPYAGQYHGPPHRPSNHPYGDYYAPPGASSQQQYHPGLPRFNIRSTSPF